MSVLEIKEVVTASVKTAQSAWRDIPTDSSAPLTDFHKTLLNLRAEILAVYKIAVLEARRTDSPEEIAEIWREVLAFQKQMFAMWQNVRTYDPETRGLVNDYREALEQLKVAATQQFEFHNGQE